MPGRAVPVALLLLMAGLAHAAVTQVQVDQRGDLEEGRAFAGHGPYERITGTVRFAVDPKLPSNRLVRDLEFAPRNTSGKVEFSANFEVLKPRDPALGNGTLLFEVSNRGGKGLLPLFNFAADAGVGDAYLLEEGYTLVWLGWQADVMPETGKFRLTAPVAKGIRGVVRSDFVLDHDAPTASLGDMGHQPYSAADLDEAAARLTVRDRVEDARRAIARGEWRFADSGAVSLRGGFRAGKIYEVLYTSQDPPVIGLGPAAVRDFVSFLKFGGPETLLADQHHYLKRALGFGISQSGRFLRDFLYEGFNADESGHPVFDGIWAHVAGAGRGNFNYRFAQASRDARPFLNFFYPVDVFPFTDVRETDELTGQNAGLLDRAAAQKVVPKLFLTNGSYEYWGRAAALIHTTPGGPADAVLSPSTRVYFIAGAQHGPGHFPPSRTRTVNDSDPEEYRFAVRALLADFQAWLADGVAPPVSRYPRITAGELVYADSAHMPRGVPSAPPRTFHKAYRVDYGPDFASNGILTEPPRVGKAFPVLTPAVDADGNDLGGVRLPEIQVPLGTYTGWNYRSPEIGAPDEMASFIGSWFPFAKTRAERLARNDARLSIEERYASREAYLEQIQAAAKVLVKERLMLERDVSAAGRRAELMWPGR